MFENYKISIFNRKGKLYLQFFVDGKMKQKSTRLEDTPANRKLIQKEVIPQLILKLKSGEFETKKKPREFGFYASIFLRQKEHLKKYKEVENIVINQFYQNFGKNTIISEIKRGYIREWVDKKLMNVTPQRVRRLLNILKAIFDIAIEYEHIEDNPITKIKLPPPIPKREMKPFTQKEVQMLIENANGYFKNYLAVAFFTGMRPGEIMALTLQDIYIDKMYIDVNKRLKRGEINTPKTPSSIRKVPIPNKLLPFIKEQIQRARDFNTNILFFNPKGKYFYDSTKMHFFYKKLIEKCNIEYRALYNTRHTFATLMIRNEVPIHLISQSMGHKTIHETLSTYAKFLPDENLKIDRNIDVLS